MDRNSFQDRELECIFLIIHKHARSALKCTRAWKWKGNIFGYIFERFHGWEYYTYLKWRSYLRRCRNLLVCENLSHIPCNMHIAVFANIHIPLNKALTFLGSSFTVRCSERNLYLERIWKSSRKGKKGIDEIMRKRQFLEKWNLPKLIKTPKTLKFRATFILPSLQKW